MFSDLGRADFSEGQARQRANLLDLLAAAGARVRWYDNNTGSKGVAARTGETDLYASQDPRWCGDHGCVDGLLVGALQQALKSAPPAAEVIVLHTKGSHGPAYVERYPPAFARFAPACPNGDLSRCTRAQVINAYDNSIVYTDHVLADAIAALKAHPERDSALLYVSDHGESTGEHGLYLHGAPYALAPDQQTRIPLLLWTSPGFPGTQGATPACLAAQAARPWSHDNLFDLALGLMGVRTPVYRPALDPLAVCRVH
jgi:lipid A ethanolaminephosphotransferase